MTSHPNEVLDTPDIKYLQSDSLSSLRYNTGLNEISFTFQTLIIIHYLLNHTLINGTRINR